MSAKIKSNLLIFLLLAASQSACADDAKLDEIYSHCRLETKNKNKKIIVDDEFISNIIDSDLSFEKVSRKYVNANVNSFKIANKHVPSITDHIVVIDTGGNYFSYYKASDRSFPLCVSVEAGGLKFMSGINIGQPFTLIKGRFKLVETVEVLIIRDLEGGNIVELYFDKNHRLKKITVKAEYIG